MYSKFSRHATCAAALLFAACSTLPWRDEPVGEEVNVAFILKNNLPTLSSLTINGRSGVFLIGVAAPRTIIDNRFAQALGANEYTLQLNGRQALRLTPLFADLRGAGDAILGAAVWGDHAVTIDYHAGLLTYQREGIHPDLMHVFEYGSHEPTVTVTVDGRDMPAVVDTTSPDTLVVPSHGAAESRRTAHVVIAGTDFGSVDIALRDVAAARIGNRLLSRFLITVDYGKHVVGLWRDPRTPL